MTWLIVAMATFFLTTSTAQITLISYHFNELITSHYTSDLTPSSLPYLCNAISNSTILAIIHNNNRQESLLSLLSSVARIPLITTNNHGNSNTNSPLTISLDSPSARRLANRLLISTLKLDDANKVVLKKKPSPTDVNAALEVVRQVVEEMGGHDNLATSCWSTSSQLSRAPFSHEFAQRLRDKIESNYKPTYEVYIDCQVIAVIDTQREEVTQLVKTIATSSNRKVYRIVSIQSPPFLQTLDSYSNESGSCDAGLVCTKSDKNYCCDGYVVDLLKSLGGEIGFESELYLVPDNYFGAYVESTSQWNGLMSQLLTRNADLIFAPFSVTSIRSTAIEFSTPFYFSGVGFLGIAKKQDVPLMAFLAPFSFEAWAAIFVTLNITALAVALFEWTSPFGLNPWGRQRTKNFSMASALWVVWGRLFSHLVAFKAPKSWPNKFLINVWGGFSVIFVASYTANIAALFAGMYFQHNFDVHDRSLLSQRVAAVKHTATHFYIKSESKLLWEHIQQFHVHSFEEGVEMVRNGSLDLLTGDGPLLDYYRGSDCTLVDVSNHDKIGDDTYAVGMRRGFGLRGQINKYIAKYQGNGYLDSLQGKWYDSLPCFGRRRAEMYGARALGVDAVLGMILMLAVGMGIGVLILVLELLVYKYALPWLREQPKGTVWRSTNIMFFSQKLYRFINCVELVSPTHAAKELINTLRHGQITSLFQKSVKREHEARRRRRKSKAAFFEMIQEVRRVQAQDKSANNSRMVEQQQQQQQLRAAAVDRSVPKLIRVLGVVGEEVNKSVVVASSSKGLRFQGDAQTSQHRHHGNSSISSSSGSSSDNNNISSAPVAMETHSNNYNNLSREEILSLWRSSESSLQHRLNQLLNENELLIERLRSLQPT